MENNQKLLEKLRKIGLSKNQSEIYLLLVAHGGLRIQEISKLTKIPRSTVYESLKELYELGIAEETIDTNFTRIQSYPLGIMKHGIDEKMSELKKISEEIHSLEHELSLNNAGLNSSTTIRYYKGRTGARQLYWNTFNSTQELCVYSDWGRERYVGKGFYESFVDESRIKKIKEKVLINVTPEILLSIKKWNYPNSPISRTRVEDIRTIDQKKALIKGDTLIYNNIYAHVFLKSVEINGFEIENQDFAQSQKIIFKTLWDLATPIASLI